MKEYPIKTIRDGLRESITAREHALFYDIGSIILAANLGSGHLAEKACKTLEASIKNLVPLYMHMSLLVDSKFEREMYIYRTAALLPNVRFPSQSDIPVTLEGREQLVRIPHDPRLTNHWQQLYQIAKEHLRKTPLHYEQLN